ncbi:MAG: hypothetical protein GIKADHBN_00313 [Phycisphaerales bacterium]|nr:hypothetical protein [Phycisphaerales bacterium]
MEPHKRSFASRHPVLVAMAVIVLVVLGWLGFEVVRALTAKPGTAGQFAAQLEQGIIKAQENLPGPDAWREFAQAVEQIKSIEASVRSQVGRRVSGNAVPEAPEGWPEEQAWPPDGGVVGTDASHPLIDAYFRQVAERMNADGVTKQLEALVTPRRAVRPIPSTRMIDILLPELGASRAAARVNHARMMLALQDDRLGDMVAAFEQSLALARITGSQATLIDSLVGVAIASLALQDVKYLIADGFDDREALEGFRAAIDRQLPLRSLHVTLESERLFASDTLAWTHSQDGRVMPGAINSITQTGGSGRIPTLGGLENVLSVFMPSREQSQAVVDAYFSLLQEDAALPAYKRRSPSAAESYAESLSPRYMVVRLLFPAISKALLVKSAHLSDVEAVKTMIALELFKLDRGAYPASLDELVAAYIPRRPVDEFDPAGLRYVVKNAQASSAADAYLLYSSGMDLVDNSGTPTHAGITGEAGKDVVYNQRRPPSKKPGT